MPPEDIVDDPHTSAEDRLKSAYPAIASLIKRVGAEPGSLLQVLEGTQTIFGYVPLDSVDLIADALQVARGEAHWVATVLHPFRFEPGPEHVIRICKGIACQEDGSSTVEVALESALDSVEGLREKTSCERLNCMGLCGLGPNVMIDGKTHTAVTPESVRRSIRELDQ